MCIQYNYPAAVAANTHKIEENFESIQSLECRRIQSEGDHQTNPFLAYLSLK